MEGSYTFSCIFKLIRSFLCSLAHFAHIFRTPRAKLAPPPRAVIADLSWVWFIVSISPTAMPLACQTPLDIGWWGDASSSFGIRVVVNDHWVAWKWAPGIKVGPGLDFDINWAEAIAVELGLRLAIHLRATNGLCNRQIIAHSDNQGIVAVVNRGHS